MKYRLFTLIFAFSIALALASCSSSGGTNVTVNLREFTFSPDHFTVKAGEEVSLNLKNLGALNHNFHIMLVGAELEEKWEPEDEVNAFINAESLDGGESITITFTAPTTPGIYQFVCSVPGHFQQGMIGTMTVTEP